MNTLTATCPVCAAPPTGETHVCPDCGAILHRECWEFQGGCGVYACKKAGQARTPLRGKIQLTPTLTAYKATFQESISHGPRAVLWMLGVAAGSFTILSGCYLLAFGFLDSRQPWSQVISQPKSYVATNDTLHMGPAVRMICGVANITQSFTFPVAPTAHILVTNNGPEAVYVTRENATSATIHLDRTLETPRTVEYQVMY